MTRAADDDRGPGTHFGPLICHAAAIPGCCDVLRAGTNVDLTDQGKLQLVRAGRIFKDMGFSFVHPFVVLAPAAIPNACTCLMLTLPGLLAPAVQTLQMHLSYLLPHPYLDFGTTTEKYINLWSSSSAPQTVTCISPTCFRGLPQALACRPGERAQLSFACMDSPGN